MSFTEYTLIRSNRKSVAIQIKPGGEVVVRAPLRLSKRNIQLFVNSKEAWIRKHLETVEKSLDVFPEQDKFSRTELEELGEQALKTIPERVRFYAEKIGVTYGKITIRNQRTRWGSCSSLGNLNFNCLLMLTPSEVLDSVVVHELCHRKEMNHSKKFYEEIYKVYPDYDRCHKWLKEYGPALMSRL